MHHSEPSRLQSLAQQLTDKVNNFVDSNERIFEMKQGKFGLPISFLEIFFKFCGLTYKLWFCSFQATSSQGIKDSVTARITIEVDRIVVVKGVIIIGKITIENNNNFMKSMKTEFITIFCAPDKN